MEQKTTDAMRAAGKTQADPALTAIQELGENVATSFEVLETSQKKADEKAQALVADVSGKLDQTRTEMAAGFKVHAEKLDALDRRSVAIGGHGRDMEGLFLAALGDAEKKDIPVLDWQMATTKKDERLPMFSSSIGATLIAHWLRASMRIQKGKFNSQEDQVECYQQKDRYEKAICEAYQIEKAAGFITTTTTLGGHWIPDPVAAELYRLITDHSIIGRQCAHVPMTTKTLDLPVEGSSSLSVTWGTESTTITDSVPASNALNKVTLTAARLNGRAVASMESLQDSAISILSWVQTKLTELAGREIDIQALEGTGSPFTGLAADTGVNEIVAGTNGDALTYAILAAIPYKAREQASRENASWAVSPEAMAKIVGLVDSQGMPVFQFNNVPNAVAKSILGYPVEVHSGISSVRTKGTGTTLSNLYFGPFNQIVIGDRMGMSWDVSDIPGFSTADVHMRLLTRLAIAVAVPKAFTRKIDVVT